MVVNLLSPQECLSPQETDKVFRALADPTRRDILRRVLAEEHSISALARRYPMSFAAVQKHVTVLADAQLVTKHRAGREALVRGEAHRLLQARAALDRLEQLWRDRVGQMERILVEDP